ncbi:BioY family transporter [Bacillus canaveralius]|uniref:Biotin transporter n=1 Tax=Bacillus canaveralius TaxID=1403243 RepID=A0A2N5GIF3_9BACI|nr:MULTISPECIES: biotin transporter BioY [Bacillus]PLR80763.1 BioY family transporter [Bacillus canaveralius]PLR84301.1 BioY family transporter [Bacillus sp. V33-4]PLR98359.1 BioY family transporter [Bacillus canaveralius]RSK52921.1 biotin transporter BioY [Bacillus canaveralius]
MNKKLRALDITLVGMFVAMMAVGANITSIVPFMEVGGVPITLQTFIAILAGAILGSRLGALSMAVYAFVGLVGVPVFAQFGAGFSTIFSPTFGFILSYILTAYVIGVLVRKNKSVAMFVTAALLGMAINYMFGTNWMYAAYKIWFAAPEGFTYKMAWLWMVVPLPKDIILSVVAGLIAHRLEITVLSKGQFKNLNRVA